MTSIYVYDGSFEGLLAAIEEAFHQGSDPEDIVVEKELFPALFSRVIRVDPSPRRLKDFVARIRNAAPPGAMRKVFCAYLSDIRRREMTAYRYLAFAFRHGKKTGCFLSEEAVSRMEELSGKVIREAHRMQGLVRFKELANGVLYAPVRTDHNVLPLISSHFVKRLPHERWVIHDVLRQQAAVKDGGRCRVVDIQLASPPVYTEEEYFYQRLWKEYFKTTAIPERRNPRLQRQFLPRRYWKYLVEMDPLPNLDA